MREIKFRIWDGKKKEWLGESNDDMLTCYGFYLVGEILTVQAPPYWALDKDSVVEQYTGLKDKNGKEIYEGDIVRTIDGTLHHLIGLVVFKRQQFMITRDDGMDNEWLGSYGYNDLEVIGSIEVIGNIHENPELVEEK